MKSPWRAWRERKNRRACKALLSVVGADVSLVGKLSDAWADARPMPADVVAAVLRVAVAEASEARAENAKLRALIVAQADDRDAAVALLGALERRVARAEERADDAVGSFREWSSLARFIAHQRRDENGDEWKSKR